MLTGERSIFQRPFILFTVSPERIKYRPSRRLQANETNERKNDAVPFTHNKLIHNTQQVKGRRDTSKRGGEKEKSNEDLHTKTSIHVFIRLFTPTERPYHSPKEPREKTREREREGQQVDYPRFFLPRQRKIFLR